MKHQSRSTCCILPPRATHVKPKTETVCIQEHEYSEHTPRHTPREQRWAVYHAREDCQDTRQFAYLSCTIPLSLPLHLSAHTTAPRRRRRPLLSSSTANEGRFLTTHDRTAYEGSRSCVVKKFPNAVLEIGPTRKPHHKAVNAEQRRRASPVIDLLRTQVNNRLIKGR